MTQNIYDRPDFFAAYGRLPRSVEGLAGAPEWPALRALLPDLHDLRIVDLGCGFGWFCRFAREQGAAHVLGIDVSENMLARAKATTDDRAISYRHADLERLSLPAAAFDLAYSSLTLHYIADLPRLMAEARRALVPGARLVVSVEHPLLTAPAHPAWSVDAEDRKAWPVNSYLIEGPRTTDWLAKGVIKQHRTFATYFRLFADADFTISHVEEWGPTDAQIAEQPELAEERDRPTFLLIAAHR